MTSSPSVRVSRNRGADDTPQTTAARRPKRFTTRD
jgi:hypothetical protein